MPIENKWTLEQGHAMCVAPSAPRTKEQQTDVPERHQARNAKHDQEDMQDDSMPTGNDDSPEMRRIPRPDHLLDATKNEQQAKSIQTAIRKHLLKQKAESEKSGSGKTILDDHDLATKNLMERLPIPTLRPGMLGKYERRRKTMFSLQVYSS